LQTCQNRPAGTVSRARALRRNATDAERVLWRALRTAFPGHKFRRQMPIGPYFADFCCFASRLVIEADGGQHAEAQAYDDARTRFIERQGYTALRFWNPDIMTNIDGVLATIGHALAPSPSHAARGPLPLPSGEGTTE
jgi:very-short-patch-repair endonuclease